MELSQAIVFGGAVVYLVSFGFYMKGLIKDNYRPNVVTWMLWASLTILNALTYKALTDDWVKSVMAFGGCVTNIGTFLLALKIGKFERLRRVDYTVAVIGFVAIFLWWFKRDAVGANYLVQLCIALAVVPTCIDVYRNPRSEPGLLWFLFGLSQSVAIVVVLMHWRGKYEELLFPINCVLVNWSVWILSLRKFTKGREKVERKTTW